MFLLSLYFALLTKVKIWQTSEAYSPQTFSVTAAVVAPAVVICLNSLLSTKVLRTSTTETLRTTVTAQTWYTDATYSIILWVPYVSTV